MAVKGIDQKFDNQTDIVGMTLNTGIAISTLGLEKAIKTSNEILEMNDFINYGHKESDDLNKVFNKKFDVSNLPYYDDNKRYRFQGFTVTDKYIYITAHGDISKTDPSVLLVYDRDGNYLGLVKLRSGAGRYSHVGGISYDSEHDYLYLTGSGGKIYTLDNKILSDGISDFTNRYGDIPFEVDLNEENKFNLKDFLVVEDGINIRDDYTEFVLNEINRTKRVEDYGDLDVRASSVYYDEINQKVYVPTFSSDSKIFVYDVKYDENGKPEYIFKTVYGYGSELTGVVSNKDLPCGIQGVATYTDKNNDTYLLMTSSFGDIDSVITKYKICENDELEFSGQYIFEGKPGLENIIVDADNGNVFCNFENYAGGSVQDGGEFETINIDKINGSKDDDRYISINQQIRNIARIYY